MLSTKIEGVGDSQMGIEGAHQKNAVPSCAAFRYMKHTRLPARSFRNQLGAFKVYVASGGHTLAIFKDLQNLHVGGNLLRSGD